MKIVMEKSWNMKNWPKVMEFCDQSWHFTSFDPNCAKFVILLALTKKFSSILESPHFPMFSAKCRKCKIGGEMVMENQEMVRETSGKNILSGRCIIGGFYTRDIPM